MLEEIKVKVAKRVQECIDIANAKLDYHKCYDLRHRTEFVAPLIQYTKTGQSAGTCTYRRNPGSAIVNFNLVLLLENFDDFMKNIIPHEVAHYVTYRYFGYDTKPHGREWKSVMLMFGAKPNRCHQYDLTSVRSRKPTTLYKYFCNCRVHMITAHRHTKIIKGKTYKCILCDSKIRKVRSLA